MFSTAWPLAQRYAELLATAGIDHGVIGPRERDRIWDRHIRNSLAIAPFVPAGASVIDVGSGAGLPGIPLALARPDLRVVLLEPLERRVRFLELAMAQLDELVGQLDVASRPQLQIEQARAEVTSLRADVVVCRALSRLERLLPMAKRLSPRSQHLVALKGSSVDSEIDDVRSQARFAGVVVVRHDVDWPDAAVVVESRTR